MTDTPAHWVEMTWAARDAAEPAMNAERRQIFDSLRPLIRDHDLPKSIVIPAVAVSSLALKRGSRTA